MKFARYLQETQIPEWEKAYIDYSGLKAQLDVIRANAPLQTNALHSFGNGDVDYIHHTIPNDEEKCDSFTLNSSFRHYRFSPASEDSKTITQSPLRTLLANLPTTHTKFFDILDAELDKVDKFYTEREQEMHGRLKLLRKQLNELGRHRQLFHESSARSKTQSWATRTSTSISSTPSSMVQWILGRNTRPDQTRRISRSANISEPVCGGLAGKETQPSRHKVPNFASRNKKGTTKGGKQTGFVSSPKAVGGSDNPLNPREYDLARKRLRKAVIEHYRGLEILNSYRILNLTGFHKVLRKYRKITKIPVEETYTKEKIEPSAFASDGMASTMLKEMEYLFAMRFERGNKKRAMHHLQVKPVLKTYHFTTFRSGLWLGLAVAAIAGGCYQSFQRQTRESLPSWNILLFIYSILLIPVLLTLLIGVNIFVWARSRINYVFILKLNPRSKLDYREYFELPSFLLCTLACAFWFSLARIGPPMLWPLIWLVLTAVAMLNPLRSFMWSQARWWTIRKIAKLGVSGLWTVEFADLWLGDQFCSLAYSLANLYFVGCLYTHSFVDSTNSAVQPSVVSSVPNINSTSQTLLSLAYDPQAQKAWSTCDVSHNWEWYFLLGVLPFLARFLQSMRRYWDSNLPSQLINAGKYGMGIVEYLVYCYWRSQMSTRTGYSYILFCLVASINSLYGCAWDYLVDWSMCKPYARYPLLRPELVYKSQILSYYLTMLFDMCIRFSWLSYVFFSGGSGELHSFIVGMLEMLRRVLWNFYRLENKHLSNVGLYRVTRELPLPYNFDMNADEVEDHPIRVRSRKRMARLS